jgi:hypothetical protein
LLIAALGCEPAPNAQTDAPNAAPVIEAPAFAPPPDPNAPPAPPPQSDVVREKASFAQTAKGKYEVNLITQPASAYFTVKDRIVFEIQIPKAMQIFEHTKNRKPTTHDEFMDQIIARNNIKLPELMPEHRYVYDPKAGELMVERPR